MSWFRGLGWLVYIVLVSLILVLASFIAVLLSMGLGMMMSGVSIGWAAVFFISMLLIPLVNLGAGMYAKYKAINVPQYYALIDYVYAFVIQFILATNFVCAGWLLLIYGYALYGTEYGSRVANLLLAVIPEKGKTFSQRFNTRLKIHEERLKASKIIMRLPEIRRRFATYYGIGLICGVMAVQMYEESGGEIARNYQLLLRCGAGFILFVIGIIILLRQLIKSNMGKQFWYTVPTFPIILMIYGIYYFVLGVTGVQFPRYPNLST